MTRQRALRTRSNVLDIPFETRVTVAPVRFPWISLGICAVWTVAGGLTASFAQSDQASSSSTDYAQLARACRAHADTAPAGTYPDTASTPVTIRLLEAVAPVPGDGWLHPPLLCCASDQRSNDGGACRRDHARRSPKSFFAHRRQYRHECGRRGHHWESSPFQSKPPRWASTRHDGRLQ